MDFRLFERLKKHKHRAQYVVRLSYHGRLHTNGLFPNSSSYSPATDTYAATLKLSMWELPWQPIQGRTRCIICTEGLLPSLTWDQWHLPFLSYRT